MRYLQTPIQKKWLLVVLFILLALARPGAAKADHPVVKGILFFSPTCGHCHKVINEVLPPIFEEYGEEFNLTSIDVTTEAGGRLYQEAVGYFKLPDERLGVPMMVIGSTVLVGSVEIPEQLPGLIKAGIVAGGVALPGLSGLEAFVTPDTVATAGPPWVEKFLRDLLANSLAVIVLIAMIIFAVWVAILFVNGTPPRSATWPAWVVPLLAVLGLGVAIYLSFVEVTQTTAFCGPVGNCNAVQQSPYATILGFLPVGVLGIIGYVAILGAWLLERFGPESLKRPAALALWGMAWFGVLFAIYLTFLEPFVIGATCMWCLSNAIIITILLWATTGPVIAQEDEA